MAQVWMKDVAEAYSEFTGEEWRENYGTVNENDVDLYEV